MRSAGIQGHHPPALAELAYWKRTGLLGRKHDPEMIAKLALKSAEQGNAYGQAVLSRCLADRQGTERDLKKALELAKKSSGAGHPLGVVNLADLEQKIDGDNGKLKRRTVNAAEAGCLIAELNLMNSSLYGTHGFAIAMDAGHRMAVEAVKRHNACHYSMVRSVVHHARRMPPHSVLPRRFLPGRRPAWRWRVRPGLRNRVPFWRAT